MKKVVSLWKKHEQQTNHNTIKGPAGRDLSYIGIGNYNNLSTLSDDNTLQVATVDFKPSRLKYQYKFGVKDGVVAFYRVTSGTIKQDGIFIDSAVKKDRLDIVFDGDATAIQNLTVEDEKTGDIYNLNGVRVKSAQKGIYIQNGKKYVK